MPRNSEFKFKSGLNLSQKTELDTFPSEILNIYRNKKNAILFFSYINTTIYNIMKKITCLTMAQNFELNYYIK